VALDPKRHYSVVEDLDGLHIIPTYRVIPRGATLLWSASLLPCGNFVATYLAQIASGVDSRKACAAALQVAEAVRRL